MVVFSALVMILGKVALVTSTRSYLIQMCKDSCVTSKLCKTSQEGIFSYACYVQRYQRHNRTPRADTEMKCKGCKLVSESIQSQPRTDLHGKEDTKTGGANQNVTPSPQGYTKMTAGKATFSVKNYTEAKTWEKALEQCQSDGGTLVKINTKEKYRSLSKYASFHSLWIGLKDLYDNDSYFWTDGTPLTFHKWQKGQPSHRNSNGKENCVELSVNIFKGSGWNDQRCEKSFGFICEI